METEARFAKNRGPLLIAAAAALWATDTLFRLLSVRVLDPLVIVFIEHLVGAMGLLPFCMASLRRSQLRLRITARQWLALALIGAGGSATATLLFTASFLYVNPSVAILLQKIQPVLTVIFALTFLGERPANRFYPWAALAVVAGFFLSFPELDIGFAPNSRGVLYALTAATLWAACTVAGRALLSRVPAIVVTSLRFFFGFIALSLMVALSAKPLPWGVLLSARVASALLYMALIPGLVATVLYYRGLARTPASVATVVELVFPVTAVVLNAVWLGATLQPTQLVAGAVLLLSVTRITAW